MEQYGLLRPGVITLLTIPAGNANLERIFGMCSNAQDEQRRSWDFETIFLQANAPQLRMLGYPTVEELHADWLRRRPAAGPASQPTADESPNTDDQPAADLRQEAEDQVRQAIVELEAEYRAEHMEEVAPDDDADSVDDDASALGSSSD